MFDILFARTFLIVGVMLCLTAITAKINKYFETAFEMWATLIISFLVLILIFSHSDSYPLNLFLVAAFSLVVGWQIGPAIEHFGYHYKLNLYLKEQGITLEKDELPTPEQTAAFEQSFDKHSYHKKWQNIITQAVLGVAIAVLSTGSIVLLTDIDFSFLNGTLLICLIVLIVMSLINALFIRSPYLALLRAYFGALIFTLFLLVDFYFLQKNAGDESWSTAIYISVNIYLDIINLFLELLAILSESSP